LTVRVTTLDSGLRVVTDAMDGVESLTVGMWVDVGARDETADIQGISHLLEHMAFKGTQRRSAIAISEEIEAVGGHLNAYTSREQTAYYARVLAQDLPLAVDLLADILQHSTFAAEELARERQVIAQEIAQVDDTPDDLIFDLFQETAYPGQPMGRSILGTAEGVAGLDRDRLRGYLREQYRAGRMVLVGAGRVEHERLVDLAQSSFGSLPVNGHRVRTAPVYAGGDRREERDLEQLHLVVGFDAVPYDHPGYYALQVLSTLLGGGMSSRLFQEVREKRGLAYSIYTFASSYMDGGLFGVYAGCGTDQAGELARVVADQILAAAEGIGEAEVQRAKAQLRAGLLMAQESSSSRAETAGRQMLVYGRPVPVAELVARIDAVTPADTAAIGRTVVAGGPPTVTAIGPGEGLAAYDTLMARLAAH